MSVDDAQLFDEAALFSNFATDNDGSLPIDNKKGRKRKVSMNEGALEITCNSDASLELQKDKYIQELEEQNSKLKAIIKRICGPHDFVSSVEDESANIGELDAPLAIVLYLSNKLCQARKIEIDQFFKNLSEQDATKELFVTQELKHQPSAIPLRPFSSDSQGKRFRKAKNKKRKIEPYVVTSVQYFNGFCFDRLGEPLLELDASISQNWEIPSYEQIFMKALPEQDDGASVTVRKVRTTSCFNCEGNHNLSDCKEPRDQSRIAANRRAFQEKYGSPSTPDSRYHASQEDEERFQSFKPGTLSEELRKALGMGGCDLPPYIYRMRFLGYPPGFLKPLDPELVIYNAEGFVEESDFNEDGEIVPPKQPAVILYPGFNSSLPEGVIDRGPEHGVPLYNPAYNAHSEPVEFITIDEIPSPGHTDMDVADDVDGVGVHGQPPLPSIEVGEEKPPLPIDKADEIQKKVESLLEIAKKEAQHNITLESYLKGVSSDGQNEENSLQATCRQWWLSEPLNSIGTIYCTYTPPPSLKGEISIQDIPLSIVTDLDREPWKTASMSWYDPLYGDLAERTGMYESIKEILKKRKKKKKRKKLTI